MTRPCATSVSDFSALQDRAQLVETTHAVRVGRDLVLLDLETDDYLCLPECGPLDIEGATVRGPMDALLRLAAEELLTPVCAEPPVRRTPPPLPRNALPPVSGGGASLKDIAVFTALWADAALQRPPLRTLAERAAGRRGRRDDLKAIAARVEVFRNLLPLAPRTGACLLQTELLLRFLNADGLDADWVVGVRAWPFLAHCWLQIGDVCVSQAPDTLTFYRPILVI